MNPSERRLYEVAASRLMCGGRLYCRGDVLSANQIAGPFHGLVQSGALRRLPQGLEADVADGLSLETEEPPQAGRWRRAKRFS